MPGEIKRLKFSDGVTVTAPSTTFFQTGSFAVYVDTAAYIAAKGTAAADGDSFYNSTTDEVWYYSDGAWSQLLDNDSSQTMTNKQLTTPQFNEAVNMTATSTELNQLDGVTVAGTSAGDIVTIDGDQDLTNKGLTSPELNEAVALTATSTELNQLDGVDVGGNTSGDILTTDGAQTVTSKTIDADNNTITNLAHGAEVDDPTSGAHGITGSFVGDSDTQTLTAKTFGPYGLVVESETVATNNLSPSTGSLVYVSGGDTTVNTMDAAADGSTKYIFNGTGATLTVADQAAGAGSFRTGSGFDLELDDKALVHVVYEDGHWNIIGGGGAGGGLSLATISGAGGADNATHYLVDSSGGGFTITLPAGSAGAIIRFTDASSTWHTDNVTLDGSGAETIDGDTALVLDVQGAWVQLMWDGSEWISDDAIVPNLVDLTGDLSIDGDLTVTGQLVPNVGIGTTNPDRELHIFGGDASQTASANSQLVVEDSGNSGISILSGATSTGVIYFGDSGSATVGELSYTHTTNTMNFWTAGAAAMTLSSGGVGDFVGGITLPTAGGTASTLDFYESVTTSSDNFTIDGNQTSQSISFHFVRVGDMVTVTNSGASTYSGDASGSGTMTWDTLIPAQFRPSSNTHVAISRLTVGGVGGQSGHVALFSSGNMTFSLQGTATWAASSTNGIQNKMSFSYTV